LMYKIAFTIIFLTVVQTAQAGDKVGNGGGLWTCSSDQTLQHGMLVDLYEAEEEFSLQLIAVTQSDPMKIVEQQNNYFKENLPAYFYTWNKILTDSKQKIHYVNAELTIVDDSLYRVKPISTTCAAGWVYTQFANYTNQDQILIRADLWNSSKISPLHKAALVWHEVIYSWLRNQFQDTDSVRARQIVGLLFSTLPPQEMIRRIEKVLSPLPINPTEPIWFCTIKNNNTSIFFGDYGLNQLEAKTTVTQKCQQAQLGFHCGEHTISCEEISTDSVSRTCQLKNYQNNRTYLGKGRNHLEAEFKTREQCQIDETSSPIHCSSSVICH
jgi:hypothetical protein